MSDPLIDDVLHVVVDACSHAGITTYDAGIAAPPLNRTFFISSVSIGRAFTVLRRFGAVLTLMDFIS